MRLLKPCLKMFAVSGLWWITTVFASTPTPTVVVSIAPFHALVSAVMGDIGTPELLVKAGASPHHYNLRPSEIQTLQQATVIFWGGPALETFLVKPLKSLDPAIQIVELDKTPKLLLLNPRTAAVFQHLGDQHTHHAEQACCGGHADGKHAKDMHFWLDPNNAKLMLAEIVTTLSRIDPAHESQYRNNAKKFIAKLDVLDRTLKVKLKPIQKMPYLVFHDAYQYFEHHYGLNGVGAISIHPELPLSLQRLNEVKESIRKTKAACLFHEPQFKSQLVDNLAKETGTHVGELDPLGQSNTKDGSDYLNLLENIADSLQGCWKEVATTNSI